jgi:hypothetical protein
MKERPRPSISELLADHTLITDAICRAVREAVLQHARAEQPVATWQNGRVVWIPAAEVLSHLSGLVSDKVSSASQAAR